MLKITSDGTAAGTKIVDLKTGLEIVTATKIEFEPIEINGIVKVKLTCYAQLDITAKEVEIVKIPEPKS